MVWCVWIAGLTQFRMQAANQSGSVAAFVTAAVFIQQADACTVVNRFNVNNQFRTLHLLGFGFFAFAKPAAEHPRFLVIHSLAFGRCLLYQESVTLSVLTHKPSRMRTEMARVMRGSLL